LTLADKLLVGAGGISLILYILATAHGDFRPERMEPFFPLFGGLFIVYALACYAVLRQKNHSRYTLLLIFGFGVVFNTALLPSRPTLSDDMYRYIWDGRVQAAGFSPYRYPPIATELAHLRDDTIWDNMNRHRAITIYPPGAQMVFAATWRIFGDSVLGMKIVMLGATLAAGALLVGVLQSLGQPRERLIIFLWSPLLIFEVAHGVHVDALYLPLMVGAFWLRVLAPQTHVNWRYEAAIGVLLGLGVLVKLHPAILAPCLWSLRDTAGQRRWRWSMPIASIVTVLIGYGLYLQPGVDVLGFLPSYGREFFNVAPHMRAIINFLTSQEIAWSLAGNVGMPALIAIVSLAFVIFPARTPREAILRCFVPISIYLLVNHNLFSWYALWLLPLLALVLDFKLNMALVGWVFTGTIALSYTFFIQWRVEPWGISLQFVPIYLLTLAVALRHGRGAWQRATRRNH
jgi:hypothetical protein